ncbi:MAG: TRAP transporter small permease [Cocleimonas sp.]|nr:TRAP transporter small permease [Cocleimonas sp.]
MFSTMINKAEENFLSLLLMSMTLLVFAEVVLRFGFNTGVSWSQEVTLYIMAWFVLFGASYGVKVGAHIGVDSFVKLFPEKTRRLMGIFSVLIAMTYSLILMVGAWQYLATLKSISLEMDDLEVQRWMSESIVFLGFVLLMFRFIQLLIKIIKGEAEGFSHLNEAKESLELAAQIKVDMIKENRINKTDKADRELN